MVALAGWIDYWAAKYDGAYDAVLEPLAGRPEFGPDEVATVYRWKYRKLWPQRKIDRMRALPDSKVRLYTRRAFENRDQLAALLILTLIPGADAAGASAILTAQDPERYTVMDRRALQSLTALHRWQPDDQGRRASASSWLEYLEACRGLQTETGRPLRTIDRALWAANGDADAIAHAGRPGSSGT